MNCNNCKKQGISCPYTFMVIPNGRIPDPCPYEENDAARVQSVFTTGYMQTVYPEWSLAEVQKELKEWLNTLDRLDDKVSTDVLIAAEAAKLIAWVNEKHKSYTAPYTYTTATTELKV